MATATLPNQYSVTLPWVESPFFKAELAKLDLDPETKEMVTFYADNGYLIFNPEIPEAVIDAAVEGAAPELAKVNNGRLQDGWQTIDAIRQIASAPKVLKILKMLYRREPIPFQTLNFAVGTQQRTHSDSIHFNSIPQRFMCGVWVALEDVRPDNGPLHYYPGSHKMPFYDLLDMGLKGSAAQTTEEVYGKIYPRYEDFISDMIQSQGLKKAILNMKKGQALIWSSNLLHGGEPIKTPGSTRHSQVTHYFFDDCIYYTPLRSDATPGRLYIRQITNIVTGQRVNNKYFDEQLDQSNEGYTEQIKIPPALKKLGRLLPGSIKKMLKR